MKKRVWKNKSNGQLCVTIPKDSAIKEGDVVELKRKTVKKIAYSGVVGDLFHYGHLHSIEFAKSISDYNICGVFTDKAVEAYRAKPIANLKERKAIFSSLKCVDRVMIQQSRDPTENLKRIHEEFPDAEIILVHGSDWKYIPGSEYVKKIKGKVVQHPYYSRLSNFKIINKIIENKDVIKDIKEFTSYIKKKGFDFEEEKGNKTIVSTKADTLKALQPLLKLSKVEKIFSFTVPDWKNKKQEILNGIKKEFAQGKIVIRSSAVNEDTLNKSMAGCFDSVLNVNSGNMKELEDSIKKVISSYKCKHAESSFNQVLVQVQTKDIVMSGVIFTRSLEHNAPYYIINYDDSTGDSDTVTKGIENKCVIISRFTKKCPENMTEVIKSVKEIENNIPGIPLDIEFAVTKKGDVVVFQVRPLAVNINKENDDDEIKERIDIIKDRFKELAARQDHLAGDTSYFADMPDWNPAEIIGDNPNHLDYSLYDYIITDSAWHKARTSQGYFNVISAKLVSLFGNKPYINVRNSFNSFVPASISPELREKLVAFYLKKLKDNPELQDKVEFDVLYTCYELGFDKRSKELLDNGFSKEDIEDLKDGLIKLTNNLIINSKKDIEKDMQSVFQMEEKRNSVNEKVKSGDPSPKELIGHSKTLLDDCREKGTVQFSRLARLGFVAKIILKSLVKNGVVDNKCYDSLLNSISTVATQINEDFKELSTGKITKEEFIKKYYHLRPGTYDITSQRYSSNPNLLKNVRIDIKDEAKSSFKLDSKTEQKITKTLKDSGLDFDAKTFIEFVKSALESRELSKFEFTKNLSDGIEMLAMAGEEMGFTRDELAMLDINDIFGINQSADVHKTTESWKELIKSKEREKEINEKIILPPILFSEKDFDVVTYYQAKPNFITQKNIEAKIINIDNIDEKDISDIEGNIVVIENGDPGYDWIFTRNPGGLITKYGGVASHMSIRCAEFGIPAAIGCGEIIFNQVKNSDFCVLDCKASKIVPRGLCK